MKASEPGLTNSLLSRPSLTPHTSSFSPPRPPAANAHRFQNEVRACVFCRSGGLLCTCFASPAACIRPLAHHLPDLLPFPFCRAQAILLVHFSARYNRQQILDALNMWLPPSLRSRCVPFLNGIA
jgi:hypothetical protein